MDVVRKGVLIGFATKLCNGSNGVLAGRKWNGNLTLPIVNTKVLGNLRWCLPI